MTELQTKILAWDFGTASDVSWLVSLGKCKSCVVVLKADTG